MSNKQATTKERIQSSTSAKLSPHKVKPKTVASTTTKLTKSSIKHPQKPKQHNLPTKNTLSLKKAKIIKSRKSSSSSDDKKNTKKGLK